MDTAMFVDESLKIEICDWGCVLHTNENVESLWHVKIVEANENLNKKKWWMAPRLLKVQNRRFQDPLKYYTKEAKS